jgi:hypothetical protein
MAHDHDHDVADDDFDDVDIKEALGLPDALPPIRLLPLPELAALARTTPVVRQLAALTDWVGKDGREVDDEGLLSPEDAAGAAAAVGVDGDDLALLWEYALAVEWLDIEDEDDDEQDHEDDEPFRVVPGETADDWAAGDDESVFAAWGSTFAAVLSETLLVYGPEPLVEADDEEDEPEFDFVGQGMAMAVLLYLARRDGLSREEFAEVLWENAAGGHDDGDTEAHEEIAAARAEWEAQYGDAAGLLLGKLVDTRAVTDDDLIRLTPLALATLHEQLVEAGVEIPLLPPTAAELSGTELLAMAAGVSDAEFEAEADAWTAARGAGPAAGELLELAAEAEPGERMLAVAAVTRIGAPAEPAWRQNLAVPQVRAYAKVALALLSGIDPDGDSDLPTELEMTPDDLAWVATDLLAIAIDEEYPDPDELAVSFREAVPAGREQVLFEGMARGTHPDTVAVLSHLGQYHPDKQVAKAARTAAHRAESRA